MSLVPVPYPLGPSEMTSEIDPTYRNTSASRARNVLESRTVRDLLKSSLNIFELFIIGNGCILAAEDTPSMRAKTAVSFQLATRNGPSVPVSIAPRWQKGLWGRAQRRSLQIVPKYI